MYVLILYLTKNIACLPVFELETSVPRRDVRALPDTASNEIPKFSRSHHISSMNH